MRRSLWTLIFLGLLTSPAAAGDRELLLGSSYNSQEGTVSTGWLQYAVTPHDGRSGWRPQLVLAGGGIRARAEPGYLSQFLLGGGVRLRHMDQAGATGAWFAEALLLGNSKSTPALSGHLQFGTGLGYTRGRYQVVLRHISNAGLRGPNEGETMLLLGVVL